MQKIWCLLICASIIVFVVSACSSKNTDSMIKSERRFEKYIVPDNAKQGKVVDLSEGPKLKYQADFGPKSPSFDFKIVNPY